MKINCCCFWCVCGEDSDDKDLEQSKLLDNDHVDAAAAIASGGDIGTKSTTTPGHSKSPPSVKTVATSSPTTTPNSKKTCEQDSSKNSGDMATTNEQITQQEKDEKRQRVVGKFKKIRLVNQLSRITSSALLDHRPLALSIELKIDLKVFPTSDCVKVFAVSAYGVSATSLTEETGDSQDKQQQDSNTSSESSEPIVLQLRTKISPGESRGHSKKYPLKENVLDSIKFSNECLHSLQLDDLQEASLRFRLYKLHKQRRDRLLGEYTLTLADLEIPPNESGTSSISMQLHDVDVTPTQPPKVRKVSGQPSSEGPPFSHRSTIRRTDSRTSHRSPSSTSSESFRGRLFSSQTSDSEKPDTPRAASTERSAPNSADGNRSFTALHNAFRERLDRVSELEESSAQMRDNASNFQEVSRKLTEKYRQKCHGK